MEWYQYNIQNLEPETYEKWYALLAEEKKQRVNRFRFTENKKHTVAGEMLARKAISHRCHVPAESIVFQNSHYGKPYAKGLAVEFNISHSGDMVVCAVGDQPVGIDVEQIRPVNLRVAKRVCNERELRYLFGREPAEADFTKTTDEALLIRFFELWTAKEAYCKCVGTGIQGISALQNDCVLDIPKLIARPDGYLVSVITGQQN